MKILSVVGDYWHAPGQLEYTIRGALDEGVSGIQTVVNPSGMPWESLSDYLLIVLSKEGNEPGLTDGTKWLTIEQEQQIADYVDCGGCFFALHSGVCTYAENGPMRKLERGHFVAHPPEQKFEVQVRMPDHPLCRDMSSFSVFDELYEVDTNRERTSVLMESVSDAGAVQPCAWTHQQGDGQVIAFTLGHTMQVLSHPMVRRFIRNCLHSVESVH